LKPRVITPEILDRLPHGDPSAERSRRDLRRIHSAMRTGSLVARSLQASELPDRDSAPLRILEIGAGDGSLMLNVARRLYRRWPKVELTLLDRLDLVAPATLAAYASLGWSARPWVIDVLQWAADDEANKWDLVIANLFLHHFEDAQLGVLLSAIEARCRCFMAYEPRRSWVAAAGSHLVGAIGANSVTRTDAVLSVAAGFRDSEISALWPGAVSRWTVKEHAAGLFSHCFLANHATLI
jgi:hypothetical protein